MSRLAQAHETPAIPKSRPRWPTRAATRPWKKDGTPTRPGQFREAAAVYAGLPGASSTLNNGGLALHSAYVASGDTEALDRYNRISRKALTLQPGDAILTGNVADAVLSAGVADVIGTRIDLAKLRRTGQASAISPTCTRTTPDARLWCSSLPAIRAVIKAHSLLDKALLLAPNNARIYAEYEELLSFLDDKEGLAKLERRAQAGFDPRPDGRTPGNGGLVARKERRTVAQAYPVGNRPCARQLVKDTREAGGPTFAMAAASLIRASQETDTLGIEADVDALVPHWRRRHTRRLPRWGHRPS